MLVILCSVYFLKFGTIVFDAFASTTICVLCFLKIRVTLILSDRFLFALPLIFAFFFWRPHHLHHLARAAPQVKIKDRLILLHLPAEFQRGAVLDRLPEIGRRVAGRGPVVVVDPARRGLEDNVVEGILALQPAQVAYLSCNPRALATDLQRFVAAGWSIRALRAYDMFPQTAHVELLALLSPPTPPVVTARAPRRKILR